MSVNIKIESCHTWRVSQKRNIGTMQPRSQGLSNPPPPLPKRILIVWGDKLPWKRGWVYGGIKLFQSQTTWTWDFHITNHMHALLSTQPGCFQVPRYNSSDKLKSAIRTDAVASIVTGSRWAPTGVRSNTIGASGIPWAVCVRLAFVEI